MILDVSNLCKSYQQGGKKLTVLQNMNFQVESSQSIAILGKSGSGKSTFLSLMSGLDKPDSGKIMVQGKDVVPMSEKELAVFRAKHIGIVFQQFHLLSNLTALENVMLPLEILQEKDVISKAREILDKVGLSHRLDHFPSELSGGESQRVAIARALVTKPEILLADEPSGNLDEVTGETVMNLLFDLVKNSSTTLLLVTHDRELALKCNKVYELKDHQLLLAEHA